MAEYPFVRMGDFLRERKEFITIDDMEVYKRAKVQWYGKGTILRDKVPGVEIKTKKQQVIRTNEFVVAEIDAKDGSFGVTPEELDGAIVSSHYFVYEVDRTLCLPSYLEWYVRTNNLQALVKAQGSTNYSAIRSYTVYDYKIPLPPLTEQRRIVAHIESLAARVNEAQRLREEADLESELLFASYLKATRHQLLENGFPKSRIGDIATVTSGGTPSRDNPMYWNGDIPWIKTGELVDDDIYDSEEYITEEGMRNSSARLFPPETILIALYGQGQTRGRTARLMIEATTNQACCAILPTPEILDSRFTQYWQRSLYYEMREKSHGGAQPNWNGGMIKNIEIALPPLDEQRRIVAYLDGLQAKVNALRELQVKGGEELSALMPSVLDRAFKGEL